MNFKNIDIPLEKIKAFCNHWQVIEFALFGSVLRDDFDSDSDIDVMVEFNVNTHPTFVTLEDMETELKAIFNREIDLITRNGIENSRNYLRRQEILSSAKVIYANIDGCSKNEFINNIQLQDAVIRRLLMIAEAARRVSETTRQNLFNISWREINGMRNRLVHEYDDINLNIVWDVIH